MIASTPVGGISAIRLVPCARCWLNANSNTRRGTKRTPPPIPNIPEATPQTHAVAKIPRPRPVPSAMGRLLSPADLAALESRLSPKQQCGQHEETAEQALQIP